MAEQRFHTALVAGSTPAVRTNMVFEQRDLIRLPIYISKLSGIDNNLLFEEISNTDGVIRHDLASGYLDTTTHTYYEDTPFPRTGQESLKLKTEMLNAINCVSGKEMKLDGIWAIFLNQGNSVSAHTHKSNTHMYPMEYYSAAYYVNAPKNSAKLIFNVNYCNTMEETHFIDPEPGMLVVFNSFISHMTSRHGNSDPRLVVSASFSPKSPNMSPQPDWSGYDS